MKRTRSLLHIFLPNKAFLYLFILHALQRSPGAIHGGKILRQAQKQLDLIIPVTSSAFYAVLHQLEKEKFVISEWDYRILQNKKVKRMYYLTPLGEERLKSLKREKKDALERCQRFFERAAQYMSLCLSNSEIPKTDEKMRKPISISSFLFTVILMELKQPMYAHQLKECVHNRFPEWKVSDGTLYPLLSKMEQEDYVISFWKDLKTDEETFQRTIRIYQLTPKGRETGVALCRKNAMLLQKQFEQIRRLNHSIYH